MATRHRSTRIIVRNICASLLIALSVWNSANAPRRRRKTVSGTTRLVARSRCRRRGLVEQQSRNRLTEAETEAKAMELEASVRAKEVEIRFGLYQAMSPQALVGLALKEWAGSAGKIDNLTITPDLVNQVVQWIGRKEA